MKGLKLSVLSAILCAAIIIPSFKWGFTGAYAAEPTMLSGAKSACLMEADGGEIIYSKGDEKRLPIASMTKIMTLNIVFERIEDGSLDINEEITVSAAASGMGGSQVFLQADKKYRVKELIKSVIVASANDSSVALAEKVAGGESSFVTLMNEKADEWGMKNTCFSNATGLPGGKQYSTAKDVAIMLSHLIRHKTFFDFSTVWLDSFAHPDGSYTTITNTNKLIRRYAGCDGGKTGYTQEAGFCVAATAKRGALRMICVVLGEKSSDERFDEVSAAFDYSFANYGNKILVEENEILPEKVKISGGMTEELTASSLKRVTCFYKVGDKSEYTFQFLPYERVTAPVKKGDEVGEIVVFKDGVEQKRVKAYSAEEVAVLSYGESVRRAGEKWKI